MIEIKRWWDGVVLHRSEKPNLLEAMQEAVALGASLDGASLDGASLVGARLDRASLVGARLDRASLDGASLVGASLDGASLDGASLDGASLVGARLDRASLVGASLDGASLDGASLVGARLDRASLDGARLDGASLDRASLETIRNDVAAILAAAPAEVPGLLLALREGRFDGSHYQGDCACLLGTIANIRGQSYDDLTGLAPDSSRPAEIWALAIRRGDTPTTSQVAKITEGWIVDWLAKNAPAADPAFTAPVEGEVRVDGSVEPPAEKPAKKKRAKARRS